MIHSSFTELDSDNKRNEEKQRIKAFSPCNVTSAEEAEGKGTTGQSVAMTPQISVFDGALVRPTIQKYLAGMSLQFDHTMTCPSCKVRVPRCGPFAKSMGRPLPLSRCDGRGEQLFPSPAAARETEGVVASDLTLCDWHVHPARLDPLCHCSG